MTNSEIVRKAADIIEDQGGRAISMLEDDRGMVCTYMAMIQASGYGENLDSPNFYISSFFSGQNLDQQFMEITGQSVCDFNNRELVGHEQYLHELRAVADKMETVPLALGLVR